VIASGIGRGRPYAKGWEVIASGMDPERLRLHCGPSNRMWQRRRVLIPATQWAPESRLLLVGPEQRTCAAERAKREAWALTIGRF
jgi:hypothetical protein